MMLVGGCVPKETVKTEPVTVPPLYVGVIVVCGEGVYFVPFPRGMKDEYLQAAGWTPVETPDELIEILWEVDQLYRLDIDTHKYDQIVCFQDLRSV